MLKLSLKTLAAILIPVMIAFAMTSHASSNQRSMDEDSDLQILSWCSENNEVVRVNKDGEHEVTRDCKEEAKTCKTSVLRYRQASYAAATCN